MSEEYAGEFSEVPAEQAATEEQLQDGVLPFDSSVEEESSSVQEDSSPSAENSTPLEEIRRDLYGRYGDVNRQMQNQSRQLEEVTEQLGQLASNLSTPREERSDSIYDTMDADQKAAATRLVEEHPVVKDLKEFRDNIVNSQSKAVESELKENRTRLASAVDDLRKEHGSTIADEVGRDLYAVAELAQWDLSHPYFKARLKEHDARLQGDGKTKQQERQRATSERGSARSSGGRLPSAKRKTPKGEEYYSFAAAADIAERIAAEKRRNQ